MRIVILALVLLVGLPVSYFASKMGYDYWQAKRLKEEASQDIQFGNYKEAVDKLTLALSKWGPDDFHSAIQKELNDTRDIANSKDNFDQGKMEFDAENYGSAINYFNKVVTFDKNYITAQSYIHTAKNKIAEAETNVINVLGLSTKPSPTPLPVPSQLPTLLPTAFPTPQLNPNQDSICKNKASLDKIQLIEAASNKLRETMPELFSFEVAKKKYPGEYTSQYMSDSYFMNVWAKNSQTQLTYLNTMMQNDAEKLYYQDYNQCLTQK